jgi:antitoxin (DNA-binding transcriptional repressor) of toxin-antitoxin stability system
MEKTISATEAARNFSDLLNTVHFRGEKFVIEKNGKPFARISPIERPRKIAYLGDLETLLQMLPKLADDIDAFSADLEEIAEHQPPIPGDSTWA